MNTTETLRCRFASISKQVCASVLLVLLLSATHTAVAQSAAIGSSSARYAGKDTWLRRQLLALTQGLESIAATAEMRPDLVLYPLDNAYAPNAFHSFNADGRLFDDGGEERYRETLNLLLSERQMRIWLRQDLKLLCELKRYRRSDDGRELGLKIALSYRFR